MKNKHRYFKTPHLNPHRGGGLSATVGWRDASSSARALPSPIGTTKNESSKVASGALVGMRVFTMLLSLLLYACSKEKGHNNHRHSSPPATSKVMYTCPMPEDSVFSDRPGTCPKCGMELIKVEKKALKYTCPMHPEVISDKPSTCPKCGMDLEPMEEKPEIDTLAFLLQPSNQAVVSLLRAVVPTLNQGAKRIAVQGYLTYDPNKANSISARVAGRVEKLYVKSNYQRVSKGEKLLELYSPELQAAQQEYLYLAKSKEATDVIAQQALHHRLLNLGMTETEITALDKSGKVAPYVPVYAHTSGHVHFLNGNVDIASHALNVPSGSGTMAKNPMDGEENQVLREGDYVKKGDLLFAIADQSTIWALLKVKPSEIQSVKVGQVVELEVGDRVHEGKVDFIERSFEDFYTLRVPLQCEDHTKLKIGQLVQGYLSVHTKAAEKSLWVPASSVLSLGKSKSAVFVKQDIGYKAKEVRIGAIASGWIEIRGGLSAKDSIAPVASYLVDSEAFIEPQPLQAVINP